MNASTPEAALAHFQAGRLAESEAAWREVLSREPGHAQALHLLGVILARTGRRDEGLALLDQSIARAPAEPAFLNNRALVLSEAGRLADAERDLRRALQLEPRFAAALVHLGSLLRQQGRLDEALAACRRALQQDPRSAEAHVGLGNVLRERGDAPGALAAYQGALAIDPRHAIAHYNRGNLALDAGDFPVAEASFRAALERDPRNATARNNLGVALRRMGRLEEARAAFEAALALAPAHAEALNNLGLTLQQLGRGEEALARYAAAVAARPGFAGALVNWGTALKEAGDPDGARALYDRALALEPGHADALNNRANLALDRGEIAVAKSFYRRAAEARPDFPDPRFSLAQAALFEHDFATGWDGYELRFDTSSPMAVRRALALPPLTPAMLGAGARVAVWREQGIGDLVLFSTLLPELLAAGARPVVELDARLVPIYARALPAITFVAPEAAGAAFAECDAQVPIGSLPRLFRRDAGSFARQPRALLKADPARVAAYRAELGPGRWIAVSWRSLQKRDRRDLEQRKSMPVEALAPLAAREGVRLLDVQYGDVSADRAAFEARHPGTLVRLAGLDTFNDIEGLLAALEACESVVTVSNVTAHLAGALGKPTSLLYTGTHPPFHYWAAGGDGHSLWYPSVRVRHGPAWAALTSASA